MKTRTVILLVLMFCLPLSGCMRPYYEVKVDAFAGTRLSTTDTYVLLPGNRNIAASDLQFREFSGYVMRALVNKGYRRIADIEHADVVIYLAYGISEPKHHEEITSFPVMGQTGMTVYTDPATGGTTHFSTIGVIGYDISSYTSTTYTSYLLLEAYDQKYFQATGRKKQLWKLTARSSGQSGDLRAVFPAMMAASQEYLAIDIGRQVTIEITEDDPRLLSIKGLPVKSQSEQK